MPEPSDEDPKVEVVVINLDGNGGEPALPKYQTAEEQEREEWNATHQAVHLIVDLRMMTQEVHEAAEAENIAAFDQANAVIHDKIQHLPINRLRNALLITIAMLDTEALRRVVYEYCGKPEEDDDE